jgi:hypothetical protein
MSTVVCRGKADDGTMRKNANCSTIRIFFMQAPFFKKYLTGKLIA